MNKGVAHVVNSAHRILIVEDAHIACGQGERAIRVALMDDGSQECFDYYRNMGRGACEECPFREIKEV